MLGEELGLVGTLLVLALFLTLAYAGFRVAMRTDGPVRPLHVGRDHHLADRADDDQRRHGARLCCPVIGIPMPLVSYGGSALLPSLVALGLLVSFARAEPGRAGRAPRPAEAAHPGGGDRGGGVPRRPR